jgi:hypothetical protein
MKKCRECKVNEATEGSGNCFSCSEELAHLLAELRAELGIEIPSKVIAGIAYGNKG